jgi:hypothetical protein
MSPKRCSTGREWRTHRSSDGTVNWLEAGAGRTTAAWAVHGMRANVIGDRSALTLDWVRGEIEGYEGER